MIIANEEASNELPFLNFVSLIPKYSCSKRSLGMQNNP